MSCNYADGLSPYEHKGVLGVPEKFDDFEVIKGKCDILADWMINARHVVLHTGAGISTSAGIPDFRGPNGVWTLEKQGKKPNFNVSFQDAIPTITHMAIKKLIDENYVKYIISQNIDGLHMRTGISRKNIAELHGNMFIEQCNVCESQFIRNSPTTTVGKKSLDANCRRSLRGRVCRGKLHDTILDWEDNLPDNELEMSELHSSVSDLNICLGTTLQIVPSGNLPLRGKKFGGRLVIVNLQPTKHDKKADLIINSYVDDVLALIMKNLGFEIPEYSQLFDPTKNADAETDWTLSKCILTEIKTTCNRLTKSLNAKRKLNNNKKNVECKVFKKEEDIKTQPNCFKTENYNVKVEPVSVKKYETDNGVGSENVDNLSSVVVKNDLTFSC